MSRSRVSNSRLSKQYWVLLAFLTLIFLTGGGSRADIVSLLILRPVAVFVGAYALFTLSREHIARYRFLFALFTGLFLLVAVQLLPLPPALWHMLPGRAIIADVDKVAQLGNLWRPVAMVPSGAWNALFSLFVPLAVLLLGAQLGSSERRLLLIAVLALAMLSAILGALQLIGDPDGFLFPYQVTNKGSAVGLFANRNHHAMLLAGVFAMLAVFASSGSGGPIKESARRGLAVIAGVLLVPLLLMIGSRMGMALGFVGLIAANFLYLPSQDRKKKQNAGWRANKARIIMVGGTVFLALATILLSRAESYNRLFGKDSLEELRYTVWQIIWEQGWAYFPVGSGIGSFVELFQLAEPDSQLDPSYLNHAHNDFLEVIMTAGVPGSALLLMALSWLLMRTLKVWRTATASGPDVNYGRMASVFLCILVAGSWTDYPLRVPSLMAVSVIAALWLSTRTIDQSGSSSR